MELLHADSEMSLPGYFLSDCDVVQEDGVDLAVRCGGPVKLIPNPLGAGK